MTTYTCNFVLAGERVEIEFNATPVARIDGLTIDLKPLPVDATRYAFSGSLGGGAGQIVDRLAELAKRHNATDVIRLCELWNRLHLNDVRAGTRAQTAALAEMPPVGYPTSHYVAAWLKERGLYEDNGYKYGSSWLYAPADPADVAEAQEIIARLDGQRIGKASLAADAEDDAYLEEASFSNSDDVIDSLDVIARIEALTDFLADHPEHEEAAAELKVLQDLEDEASGYGPDWRYGSTLIRDSYFAEYAEQFAKDIGAIKRDADWPNNHIDWKAAARDLQQQDYTAVEFGDVTYWIR